MSRLAGIVGIFALVIVPNGLATAAEPIDRVASGRFFALCVGTHDANSRTPTDQAKLLKELGYAGNCHVWCDGVAEALKAVDQHGIQLSQLYVRVSIAPDKPNYDARLPEVIKLLAGRRTIVGLLVSGGPPSSAENDAKAVEAIREIAAMAEKSGVKAALYPHTGDWLERIEDAVRVAKKVDRKNVGVMFNLCHWLQVDGRKDLRPLLKAAMPHLFAITINGADNAPGGGWGRLIQPLGSGTFDNFALLAMLDELGYTGPIGLQCYGVKGNVRDNLTRSMAAWNDYSKRLTAKQSAKPRLSNPFFAFDNGTGRGRLSPQQQADMLAELGYAGIGYTGGKGIPEMLAALDRHKLEMFSIYVGAKIGPEGPSYDPNLKQAIEDLKGRHTLIWLTVTGNAPNGDEQATAVVREIGQLAKESGLRVAMYPHVGFYVARTEDAVRIAEKVKLKNVGVSLNLCHWLKVGDEANMELRIKQAMPWLFAVSINGADHEGNWDRLIQTLDRGEFDVYAFLRALKQHGYDGPIGLQCYAIRGDSRENLTRSITAWRKFVARMENTP